MKQFCKKHNLTENQFLGNEKINGSLYLSSLTSIPDGFNPTVGGSLDLNSLTSIPDGFNPTVGGSLYLSGLTSIPDGFNPTVGGSLNLRSLTSIPDGFNPTVGGYLYLSGLTSIPDGFNPTVGGYLDLSSLTSIPDGFNPTVGGYLYLNSLTSIPDGFNPTVGGYLDLSSLTSIPDGFNPTVGGYLYLNSLTSIPDGFNPTVGGSLDLSSGLNANHIDLNNNIIFWQNGKYLIADNVFTEVILRKGNIFKVKKLNESKEFWLVTDGGSFHAHGDTLEKANEDLQFKVISEKLKNEPIKEDTVLTIQYYRLLTGACELGVKKWMQENKIDEGITAIKLLPILEKTNAYGLNKFKSLIQF